MPPVLSSSGVFPHPSPHGVDDPRPLRRFATIAAREGSTRRHRDDRRLRDRLPRGRATMPALKGLMARGFSKTVRGVMPSVTNVNNASIACGAWPEEHGITGNSFFDESRGRARLHGECRLTSGCRPSSSGPRAGRQVGPPDGQEEDAGPAVAAAPRSRSLPRSRRPKWWVATGKPRRSTAARSITGSGRSPWTS